MKTAELTNHEEEENLLDLIVLDFERCHNHDADSVSSQVNRDFSPSSSRFVDLKMIYLPFVPSSSFPSFLTWQWFTICPKFFFSFGCRSAVLCILVASPIRDVSMYYGMYNCCVLTSSHYFYCILYIKCYMQLPPIYEYIEVDFIARTFVCTRWVPKMLDKFVLWVFLQLYPLYKVLVHIFWPACQVESIKGVDGSTILRETNSNKWQHCMLP